MGGLLGTVSETRTGLMSPTQLFNAGFSYNISGGVYKIASINDEKETSIYYRIVQTNYVNNAVYILNEFCFAGKASANGINGFYKYSKGAEVFSKIYKKGNDLYMNLLSGLATISINSNKEDYIFKPVKSSYTTAELEEIPMTEF